MIRARVLTAMALLLASPAMLVSGAPTRGITYVPKQAASCQTCAATSTTAACRKCPQQVVVGAQKDITFKVGGQTVWELGPQGVVHQADAVIRGDVIFAAASSLTTLAGAQTYFDNITSNTLVLKGPGGFGTDPGNALKVTGGDVLFQSFNPNGGQLNTVSVSGMNLVVDGDAKLNGESFISEAKIGGAAWQYQGPNTYGPFPDIGGTTPVMMWGGLVCDNTNIGAMAVGWRAQGSQTIVPIDNLIPGNPSNGAPYTNFRNGVYVMMFCAPGGFYPTPGWLPFPSPLP